MIFAGLILGGAGAALALLYPTGVDIFCRRLFRETARRLKALLEAPPQPEDDLHLTRGLIAYLRAGISLDSALDQLAEAYPRSSPLRTRAQRILLGGPGNDFLHSFLRASLESGAPALPGLTAFERALKAKSRLQLKARGITGQCRAQAEVLSWLPWILGLAILVIDPSWAAAAAESALSWILWAAAVALGGAGRSWIRRSLRVALNPRSEEEKLEEERLPELALALLSFLARGLDTETAAEESGLADLFARRPLPLCLAQLRAILQRAARTGAPVREELLAFLEGQQAELEARWEERVQRLPVSLLLPLFTCFFPSCLLVLGGLLVPVLTGAW